MKKRGNLSRRGRKKPRNAQISLQNILVAVLDSLDFLLYGCQSAIGTVKNRLGLGKFIMLVAALVALILGIIVVIIIVTNKSGSPPTMPTSTTWSEGTTTNAWSTSTGAETEEPASGLLNPHQQVDRSANSATAPATTTIEQRQPLFRMPAGTTIQFLYILLFILDVP
ncbi:unnamed protein product [Cylicocyclus nassatus]|uniref:Uncharacterized protein n=1 Tax=Cylicocyclus nassatus TaxID=53992 RepID=A0AA36H755_CYLNA|nr:unnamed protein product [Cylicocyclus nassatus]